MTNFVSVIVPNLHSPVVDRTLASLRAQTFDGALEIIVVGQDRYGHVQADERVKPIFTPQPVSPAAARNTGIRAAQGEFLAFIDADCVAAPDWLTCLLACYQNPDITVVGGSVSFPDTPYWALCDNVATFNEYLPSSPAGSRQVLPSLNLSIRASALHGAGMFDERYPFAAEDADLTTRLRLLGHELKFEPRANVMHCPQGRGFAKVMRRAYDFGRYSVKVDRRYQAELKIPWPLRKWWATLLFSGALAGGVVSRIILYSGLRYGSVWPMVFLIKLVWCLGAARTLQRGTAFE